MSSTFPKLGYYPGSGLPFYWTEWQGGRGGLESSMDAHLGSDGVTAGFEMLIYWADLYLALQSILGWSYYDGPGVLRRKLPWQHPLFNQLWVKAITRVKGLQMNMAVEFDTLQLGQGAPGIGFAPNLGPSSSFTYALLTIQFWRPTYYLKTDNEIAAYSGFFGGRPAEWLRYVDRDWKIEPQMLTREGGQAVWGLPPSAISNLDNNYQAPSMAMLSPPPAPPGSPPPSPPPSLLQTLANTAPNVPFGTKIAHLKLSRMWHEVPAQCLFALDVDGSPTGSPDHVLYTQTNVYNPMTGYLYVAGNPITGTVNTAIGGDYFDNVANPDAWIFGCYPGTLLFEGADIVEKPIQLPPALMGIGIMAGNWPLAQTQYDVIFHFDYFDPPTGKDVTFAGHNLVPFPGDNLWYPLTTIGGVQVGDEVMKRTLFDWSDFSDLFGTL